MTPYAIFVLAFLAPAAAAMVGVVVVRRRRREGVSPLGRLCAGGAVVFLVASALAVAGWVVPDAFDRLSPAEQADAGPVLSASFVCGTLPFPRVLEVAVEVDTERGTRMTYRCGMTPFGVFVRSGEASCGDGQWRVPGYREVGIAGSCGP